jgi:hypothetical protein
MHQKIVLNNNKSALDYHISNVGRIKGFRHLVI